MEFLDRFFELEVQLQIALILLGMVVAGAVITKLLILLIEKDMRKTVGEGSDAVNNTTITAAAVDSSSSSNSPL